MVAHVFDSLPWGKVPQAGRPCENPGSGRSACLQAIRTGSKIQRLHPHRTRRWYASAGAYSPIRPGAGDDVRPAGRLRPGSTMMPRTAPVGSRGLAILGCFTPKMPSVLGAIAPTAVDALGRWSAHRSDPQPRWHRN